MSLVDIHNEWDPLEEIIVGVVDGARVPSPDRGLFALDYCENVATPADIPTGPYDDRVISETREDLEGLVALLESEGVTVRRPEVTDHTKRFGTPDWTADGEYNYCPRDLLLPIGDTIIETPMANRTRYFETFAYRNLLREYFDSGTNWISAPKPQLLDDTYNIRPVDGVILNDHEPVFDAANVLRVGEDILYLVSCSGNDRGLRWLQRVLGERYRVHAVRDVYPGTHIDTTITLVRPGLVVISPERVKPDQVPEIFANWEILWCPDLIDSGYAWDYPRASIWQGMNFMMIRPDLAVVSEIQTNLIRELEKRDVTVAPTRLRHSRTLSGGFHCATLDIRRRGSLQDHR